MKYANKILYIGAGLHMDPLHHFQYTKEFVFIDTLPRSEFDTNNFYLGFYSNNFIDNLKSICLNFGFTLNTIYILDQNYYKQIFSFKQYLYYLLHTVPEFINPTLLYFTNNITGQSLRYYVSTNIEYNMTDTLKRDIDDCDGLIVSGYHPKNIVLNYFTGKKTFFGYTDTCYKFDYTNLLEDEKDTIIYFLNTCICSIQYYFGDFYMVDYDKGDIKKCRNFNDFNFKIQNNKNNAND